MSQYGLCGHLNVHFNALLLVNAAKGAIGAPVLAQQGGLLLAVGLGIGLAVRAHNGLDVVDGDLAPGGDGGASVDGHPFIEGRPSADVDVICRRRAGQPRGGAGQNVHPVGIANIS